MCSKFKNGPHVAKPRVVRLLISVFTLRTTEHLVLKIAIKSSDEDAREQRAFHRVEEHTNDKIVHPGLQCLQRPLRDFVVNDPRTGRHHCFLLTPSACHVEKAWQVLGDLPLALTKEILVSTLKALDFLHAECSLIHTDIKLDNILFGFAGDAHIAKYVEELEKDPERSKIHYGKDGDQYPVTKAKQLVSQKYKPYSVRDNLLTHVLQSG